MMIVQRSKERKKGRGGKEETPATADDNEDGGALAGPFWGPVAVWWRAGVLLGGPWEVVWILGRFGGQKFLGNTRPRLGRFWFYVGVIYVENVTQRSTKTLRCVHHLIILWFRFDWNGLFPLSNPRFQRNRVQPPYPSILWKSSSRFIEIIR